MSSISKSLSVALAAFVASLIGMACQSLIPTEVLNASKASVGAMAGVIGLLLALVLGLLVWTAFGVFASQQAEAFSLAPVIAEIDRLLELIGPEAAQGRAGLRVALRRSRERFFASAATGPQMFSIAEIKATRSGLGHFFERTLISNEDHRRLFQTAHDHARKYQDTQIGMLIRLASPFPPRVLEVVVFWTVILFLGNGLAATPNAVTIVAHLVGAACIGSAIFLILELSHPYTGWIKLAPDGLDHIIAALEETNEPAFRPAQAPAS